jgi:hypothetical protein
LVRYTLVFKRIVGVFNFLIIKMRRFINLLQNKSNSLRYIDYSIGTYQKKILPNIYIGTIHLHRLLRNNCFQRMRMNIFTVKN